MLRIRHEMTSVPCPDGRGNAPINHIANASKFATPADRTVVAPNTDTLYSLSQLDLKKGPIVLRHPDMGNRFFDFELVDPWTNVIDYVGTRTTGSKAGRFTIRWTGDGKAAKAKRLGNPIIKSKYRRVWLIGRTLAGDEADQAKAYDIMKRYKLLKPNGNKFKLPADCHRGKGEPSTYPLPTDGADFVAQLNEATVNNPPPKRDQPLLEQLAPLGVGPGLSPEDAGLAADVLAALYDGVAGEQADAATASPGSASCSSRSTRRAGCFADSDIGDFGTDYRLRAEVADRRHRRQHARGGGLPRRASPTPTATCSTAPTTTDGLPGRRPAPGQVLLVADDVRPRRLPRRQPDRPLLARPQPPAADGPRRRLDRRRDLRTTSRPPATSTGCPRRAVRSGSTCASTGRASRCSNGDWPPPPTVKQP